MQFLKDFRRRLEQLGPYASLLVLAIPLVIVEPFKLVAVLVAGDGHFLTGLLFLICAYVVSLVVTERLFVILKPKLLMLPWFAKSWRWFLALRRRGLRWLRSLWTPAGKFYLAADASGGGAPNGPTYGTELLRCALINPAQCLPRFASERSGPLPRNDAMGRKRKSPVINATQMDGDESISNETWVFRSRATRTEAA